MNNLMQHRRNVLKMMARVRLIFKRVAPLATRYASLTVLVVVVGAAFAALTIAKLGTKQAVGAKSVLDQQRPTAATQVATPGARAVPLAKRDTIVYIVTGDRTYYHTCTHVFRDAQRQAVTLDVASAKGLAPCPVCCRASGDAARPVVNQ
jgi:hypothetical protein